MKYQLVEEDNEASELQATIEANISKKAIFEPKSNDNIISENIEIEKKVRIPNIVGYKSDIIPSIDFTALTNSSDFKRLIYLAITGKAWRGTNAGLELALKSKLKKLKGSEQ